MTNALRLSLLLLALLIPIDGFSVQYKLDEDHTNVGFSVRHIFTKVQGRFDKFEGSFSFDPKDSKDWNAVVTIQAASVNTFLAPRDKDLRSPNFFDVDNPKHPEFKDIKFVSTKVTDVKGNKAKVHGKLTIKGITKNVILDMEILGTATDPWGNKTAGFSARTMINRKDFGLTWNKTLETGGVLVGDEVEITLDVTGLEVATSNK